MNPLISIVIPVFNGEKFIKNCVESIVVQTIKEIQIIIVDDGSQDNTLSILRILESKDERIEVIHQNNAGVSAARNIGLQAVQAEWVLFVDADDKIEPDYCLSLLDAASDLCTDVIIARPSSKGQSRHSLLQEKQKLVQACLSYNESSYSFNIDAPWGKLFRYRVICEKHICFPEELTRSEDAYFCLRFYEAADSIGVLNQFGYIHMEREGSICHRFESDSIEMLEKILCLNQQWIMTYHSGEESYLNALWYRVLPGIVECERSFFLHPEFSGKLIFEYQKFLRQPMICLAIHNLKLSTMLNKQYKMRLSFYKLHLGWLFILLKKSMKNSLDIKEIEK